MDYSLQYFVPLKSSISAEKYEKKPKKRTKTECDSDSEEEKSKRHKFV